MKNKKKLVIVSLLFVALFSFSVISSIASTYTPEIDMESMEEKINAFSNSTTQYKVELASTG